nr:TPM domain-containing protein [Lysinibacter cavernae]
MIASLAAALIVGPVLFGATGAYASDPVTLGKDRITDESNVLGDNRATAEQAIENLYDETHVELFVAFVDQFTNPTDAEQWANTVAEENNLGPNDVLLAVATRGRAFYLSVDSAGPVSTTLAGRIEQYKIQPALREDDWAGAVVSAAAGIAEAANGESISYGATETPSEETTNPVGAIFGLLFIGSVIWLVVVLRHRSKLRKLDRTRSNGEQPWPTPSGQPHSAPEAPIDIASLERDAATALVAADDAIRTSDQELSFAVAQYGEPMTGAFSAAVASAKGLVAEAFRLRQLLDDNIPDTDAQIIDWNRGILSLCAQADAVLDAEAATFAELRSIEKNPGAELNRVRDLLPSLRVRVTSTEGAIAGIRERFAPSLLVPIEDNANQAQLRVELIQTALDEAATRLASGDNANVAVCIRVAEDAASQALGLCDAVHQLGIDLEQVRDSVGSAINALDSELIDARLMQANPQQSAVISDIVSSATATVQRVRQALTLGGVNPYIELEQIQQAAGQVAKVLEVTRGNQANHARQLASAEHEIASASAQLSATQNFISARVGAVGTESRTRFFEASRKLDEAKTLMPENPDAAFGIAQSASSLANQAMALASADVGVFQQDIDQEASGVDTGISGLSATQLAGAFLGGILVKQGRQTFDDSPPREPASRQRRESQPYREAPAPRRSQSQRTSPSFGGSGGSTGGGRSRRGGGRF